MVMMIEPVFNCITHLTSERKYDEVIYTSPDGTRFTQAVANELSMKENIIILAGHYKGIDQRIRDNLITREISIGDYVLTGGELPAMILVDAVSRLVPNVLGNNESALFDTFATGLLEHPQYTRPQKYRTWTVPEVLLSGDHKKIDQWRRKTSLKRTLKRRPDLLGKAPLSEEDLRLLEEIENEFLDNRKSEVRSQESE